MLATLPVLTVFTVLAVACFWMAWRFAEDPAARGRALYSALSGVLIVAFFIASNAVAVMDARGTLPNGPTGLLQRVAISGG